MSIKNTPTKKPRKPISEEATKQAIRRSMTNKTMYRIDHVNVRTSTDGTILFGLWDYEVPLFRVDCVYMETNQRFSSPVTLKKDKIAIFSRWNENLNEWIIWQVKASTPHKVSINVDDVSKAFMAKENKA